jgi:M6 family metalloprotease-like protein
MPVSAGRWALALTSALLIQSTNAAPTTARPQKNNLGDPFAVIDPQNWENPDDMTWDDWTTPPGTNWADPTRKGSNRNFNIALVAVDYSDLPFIVTQPDESTIFGNPQPGSPKVSRDEVTTFYHDFLNKPNDLNRGHTMHEYWMTDSQGRFGVDLTAFGVYQLPALSYQYGLTEDMNPGECPAGKTCSLNIREDALGAWRADVGDEKADSFELVFILSAGQDESSSWQEFGEMMFLNRDDVADEFGPPGNGSDPDWATTRYVDWTSWASASSIWPNALGSSSTQAESSGMATFAHELSHLLNIPDNYNNPYGEPLRRSYTGPWSMLSRGSFNGPGGPHTRWQIPPRHGGSMGCLHTLRDKNKLGLVSNESTLHLSRGGLAESGHTVVARLTARSVSPGGGDLMGVQITMDKDLSPPCNTSKDPLCDGGGFDAYNVEVIDRMGPDSFTPDSGVMLSKTKTEWRDGMYQWTIDANPQDIEMVDSIRPDGTKAMITMGDYRQLSDALFHAGTRSGSEFEYTDKPNGLHFYIIDAHRNEKGVLSYTTAVRSLDRSNVDRNALGVSVGWGDVVSGGNNTPTGKGVTCSFQLNNTGKDSDVYRLEASPMLAPGWRIQLPNKLATAESGATVTANLAVAASDHAAWVAAFQLTARSESDPKVSSTGYCVVNKYWN